VRAIRNESPMRKLLFSSAASLLVIGAIDHSLLHLQGQISLEVRAQRLGSQTLLGLRRGEGGIDALGTFAAQPRQLIDTFAHAAEAHKVQITAVSLAPESRTSALNIDVLDVKGSYPAIKALLADISNAHTGVAIRQVTLRRANQFSDIEGRVTFIVKTDPRP
jgi:hypothetical protein